MRKIVILGAVVVGIAAVALLVQRNRAGDAPAADAPQYELTGTIKELMEGIIDPAADAIFNAVATDITAEGVNEKRPQTDEEWQAVENHALMLIEAGNLLKMPGRQVAPPGESTVSDVENAPELTAEQIAAKIDADRRRWNRYATELQQTARKSLDAAKKKDPNALFDTGEELDRRCENCHIEYWYPNDPYYKERLQELQRQQ